MRDLPVYRYGLHLALDDRNSLLCKSEILKEDHPSPRDFGIPRVVALAPTRGAS